MIRMTTGGIHLNTLFIDEGFGTLDTEAFDCAIVMLIELENDGRLIGVISHVPELKERLETAIYVEPSTSGSHVRIESVYHQRGGTHDEVGKRSREPGYYDGRGQATMLRRALEVDG